MSLASDPRGNLLMKFFPMSEFFIPETERDTTLTMAMTVLRYDGRLVLVYEGERQAWEIPGGGIEDGEMIHECAVREVYEETGQRANGLRLCGLFKMYINSKDLHELGALFRGDVHDLLPFDGNDEIECITLWDGRAPLDGPISGINLKLIELGSDDGDQTT